MQSLKPICFSPLQQSARQLQTMKSAVNTLKRFLNTYRQLQNPPNYIKPSINT